MNHGARRGFTIIELLLAMTFVAMLLLLIAATVIQISNIYNKGMTLRDVDQSGRTLTDDIRRTISESLPFRAETNFVQQRYPGSDENNPDGGRLCTGRYTYVWNYGKTLANTEMPPINVYTTGEEVIRFVRVKDNNGAYCREENLDKPIKHEEATELLGETDAGWDGGLALQSFSIEQVARNDVIDQALYRIVLEVGTVVVTNGEDGIDVLQREVDNRFNTIDTSCKPPRETGLQQNFCAVNQFDFTAQAGNRGGI